MRTAGFTQMKDGTRQDDLLLREAEHSDVAGNAHRVMRALASQAEERMEGYKINQLDHALQSGLIRGLPAAAG